MTQHARWIKASLAGCLLTLAAQAANAEDFYLSLGLGRVRASSMGSGAMSLQMVAGMPVDYNASVELQHVEVQDVNSWFNDQSDQAPRRVMSAHTGVAAVAFMRPNPGVRLRARLGLGTTYQEGMGGYHSKRIWEMEPGLGLDVQLRPNLTAGLEINRFWRSEVNVLAVTGHWSF